MIFKLHYWIKGFSSFAQPGIKAGLATHKFMDWQTNLLCIVVDLEGGWSVIKGLPRPASETILVTSKFLSQLKKN